MHSAAHETRLLQQARARCQRVDVCAPSASGLELLACGGHRLFEQSELAADAVDGGLATVKLGHVGLVLEAKLTQ